MVSVRSERQICGDGLASIALSQQRCSTLISYSLDIASDCGQSALPLAFPTRSCDLQKNGAALRSGSAL
jgi:hypothetical protein